MQTFKITNLKQRLSSSDTLGKSMCITFYLARSFGTQARARYLLILERPLGLWLRSWRRGPRLWTPVRNSKGAPVVIAQDNACRPKITRCCPISDRRTFESELSPWQRICLSAPPRWSWRLAYLACSSSLRHCYTGHSTSFSFCELCAQYCASDR